MAKQQIENYPFLVRGKNGGGPELWLSSMLGGTGNIFENARSPIRVERDAFNSRHLLTPNVASVHGRLNETRESILQGVLNGEVPLDRRAHRILLRMWMSPIVRTISEMNDSDQRRFLILHPETAEWLTQQIEKRLISLRSHVLPLVENDDIDGSWFNLERSFPDLRPGDPILVRKVADRMAGVIGREVGTVLDVDHLLAASRQSVGDAAKNMRPKYLHLSGPHHQGYNHNEILRYVDLIEPEVVVLEGPIPSMKDIVLERVSRRHKERINILVWELTHQMLNLT